MSILSFDDFAKAAPPAQAGDSGAPAPGAGPPQPASGAASGVMSFEDFADHNPPEPAEPPATTERILGQTAAAGSRFGYNFLGAPVDLATAALNLVPKSINAIAGTHIPTIEHAVGGSDWLMSHAPQDPRSVVPVTPSDRVAAGIGGGAMSMLLTGGLGAAAAPFAAAADMPIAANVAKSLASAASPSGVVSGAVGGGVGAAAAENVSEPYKPLADLAGNMAGGGLAAGAIEGGRALAGAGTAMAGHLVAPFTEAGREQLVARRILSASTDPAALPGKLDVPPEEIQIIPGSHPTTAQVAADPGLANLERKVSAQNPEMFLPVAAEQNAARVGALDNLAPATASPQAVSDAVRSHLAAIDQAHDTAIAGAQATRDQAVQDIGGNQTREDYGAALRDNELVPAKAAAKAQESALWKAIDPDGTLALDVGHAKQGIRRIEQDIPQSAEPPGAREQGVYDTVTKWPSVQSFGEFQAMRQRVMDAIREERATPGGDAQMIRRLTLAKQQLDDSLSAAVERRVGDEQSAVQAGTLHPDQTIVSRLPGLQRWEQEWYNRKDAVSTGQAVAGLGTGEDIGASPAGGARGASSVYGAPGTGRGGSSGNAGNPGVQAAAPLDPNFDEAAAERYQAARQKTAENAATFKSGPVDQVLRSRGNAGDYKLADEQVAGKFFNGGAHAKADIDAFLTAVGNRPTALATLQDYAASDLRKAAVKPDGSLDQKALQRWTAKNGEALQAFPELADKFNTAKAAQDTLDEAAANKTAARDEFEKSAAGRLLGDVDPVKAVGGVFGSKNPAAAMRDLSAVVKTDPAAKEGLKRAVIDYMIGDEGGRFLTNREAGNTGTNFLKADQIQTFIRQNKGALSWVFDSDGINTLEKVAADLQRAEKSVSGSKIPGGSNTAQDTAAMKRYSGDPTIFSQMANDLGHGMAMLAAVEKFGWAGAITASFLRGARSLYLGKVDTLVATAMRDPEVAKVLLQKMPGPKDYAGQSRIAQRLLQLATVSQMKDQSPPK